MALGYCEICTRLVTIKPGPQKWGSRECEWRPIPHINLVSGILCKGSGMNIKNHKAALPELDKPHDEN